MALAEQHQQSQEQRQPDGGEEHPAREPAARGVAGGDAQQAALSVRREQPQAQQGEGERRVHRHVGVARDAGGAAQPVQVAEVGEQGDDEHQRGQQHRGPVAAARLHAEEQQRGAEQGEAEGRVEGHPAWYLTRKRVLVLVQELVDTQLPPQAELQEGGQAEGEHQPRAHA
ncbi:MAG TPA: hypothetical protein VLQ93_07730 [Myxococcaceae bacterium]|nr:hypothetical protein [Myxococcaceae bacterium]